MTTKKTFTLRTDGTLLTPEFRVSFPRIFEPNDDGKFGLSMLFDKDVDFSVLEKVIEAKKKETWPKGAPKGFMHPLLDGDQSDREEHKDKFYVNAKAGKFRPGLIDQNKQDIVDEAEFYPGCWARATINVYSWTYLGKCGVSVGVRNLQKLRDDEPLVGRVKAADEFDTVADAGTEDL